MNPEEQQALERLRAAFPERPTEVLDEVVHAKRREQVTSHIRAILAAPEPKKSLVLTLRQRPEAWGMLAVAATIALGVGYRWANPTTVTPIAGIRTLSSQGEILCRKSGKASGRESWAHCNTATEASLSGVRTLEQARLSLETLIGVRLDLSAGSTLLLGESTNSAKVSHVTLAYGSVDVRVPKLGPERRFEVATPTATVVVHGTAFSVTVERGAAEALSTCVVLREGIVSVEAAGRSSRLVAPAKWGCAPEPTGESASPETVTASRSNSAPSSSGANVDVAKRRSTLGQETRLLQLALGAERRRDYVTASRWYRALLAQYPNSVVAPEARAALERLPGQKPALE